MRQRLLAWHYRHQRRLPWRETSDPYRIWISEVMLQQTQVQTVLPYYEKFVQRYPNLKRLAAARVNDLLRIWAGLGYYSRVRNLHKAARLIVVKHGGRLPGNFVELLALPGIGRYTAGAILSIALKQPYPVLDGNVTRVLSRAAMIGGEERTSSTERRLWALAGDLLDRDKPGDFNQALMELGALLCTPRTPQCRLCPWSRICRARLANTQDQFPQKKKRAAPVHLVQAVAVMECQEAVLLVKRTSQRQVRDLWEFPLVSVPALRQAREVLSEDIKKRFQIRGANLRYLGLLKHSITNQQFNLWIYLAQVEAEGVPERLSKEACWVPLSQLEKYALSGAARKVAVLARRQLARGERV